MSLTSDGFDLMASGLSEQTLDTLLADLGRLPFPEGKAGIRHVDHLSATVAGLVTGEGRLLAHAQAVLGSQARLVRAIFFDKSADRNWFVTWHQDKTIVADPSVTPANWGPWSKKDGEWHVQPPASVLNCMITLRLHLDSATAENGALRVIAGSHLNGILEPADILTRVASASPILCAANRGDLLRMHPLLLHSSLRASEQSARRVLHLEFGAFDHLFAG